MDVCSGSRNDKHPEIAHTEGSSACPVCDVKQELEKTKGELEAAKDSLKDVETGLGAAQAELADLREKTKHMTWAVETVEEPKT